MAVPNDKDELLAAIDGSFVRLMRTLNDVPNDLFFERSLQGHAKATQMSVANLVAYLLGWNELVLKWLRKDAAGEPIDFPETGYKWNELGALAQKFYRDYETLPYLALIERFGLARAEIGRFIDRADNASLYGRARYGKWTMGRMIQLNTSSPYDNARARIRKWLKTKNALKTPPA